MKLKHALFLPLLALASTGAAQTFDNIASVTVIPGWTMPDGSHMAGLRLTLEPGWKTYWRSPGDAGITPQISWTQGGNIAAAQFRWPVPEVFDQGGARSIGYHDGVVIPVQLIPQTAGAPIRLAGTMDIGVCDEICVPVTLDFDATLPTPGARDAAVMAALVNRPMTASEADVGAVTCTVAPISDGLQVRAEISVASSGATEAVVIETNDPQVWVSEPEVMRNGQTLTATADLVHVSGSAFALDRSGVRITILGQDRAVDIIGCSAG